MGTSWNHIWLAEPALVWMGRLQVHWNFPHMGRTLGTCWGWTDPNWVQWCHTSPGCGWPSRRHTLLRTSVLTDSESNPTPKTSGQQDGKALEKDVDRAYVHRLNKDIRWKKTANALHIGAQILLTMRNSTNLTVGIAQKQLK